MTLYHPATQSLFKHYLKTGFRSMKTLKTLDRLGYLPDGGRVDSQDKQCRTLACATYEDAVEYGEAYYGPGVELKIIAIECERESYPIKGTLVPEGTVFLLGEIAPGDVSLCEPVKELSAGPSAPRP